MKARSYLVIVLLIVLLVLLVVLWPSGKDQRATITFGEIEQLNGQARTPTVESEGISTPAISPASGTEIPTPVEIVSATPAGQDTIPESDPTLKSLQVSIMDALGDPIPAGQLHVAGKEYRFTDGRISVPVPGEGEQELVAEAEGYQTAKVDVDTADYEEITIQMEYLSSFEFTLYMTKEDRIPAVGADVYLWLGPKPKRPVPGTASLWVYDRWERESTHRVKLSPSENGFDVAEVEQKPYDRSLLRMPSKFYDFGDGQSGPGSRKTRGDSVRTPPDRHGLGGPLMDDSVVGLAGCMCRPGERTIFNPDLWDYQDVKRFLKIIRNPNSPRLRVWDTITMWDAAGIMAEKHWCRDFIDFDQDGKRLFAMVATAGVPTKRELILTTKTDSQGTCRFENLPPGMYYVQAQMNGKRSTILPLSPTRGGAEDFLHNGGWIDVQVRSLGVDPRQSATLGAIPGADVLLQPLQDGESKGFLSGKTDRFGRITFKSLLWGEYHVTVTPPEEFGLSPQTRDVVIDDTKYCLNFLFDTGFSVSGQVVRRDTGEPVKGYEVELVRITNPGSGILDVQKSDDQGRFVFQNVQCGRYNVTAGPVESNKDTGLSPYGLAQTASTEEGGFKSLEYIDVIDKDVGDLIFHVLPSVNTRFIGQVTTPDRLPVEGARISGYLIEHYSEDPNPVTGPDGGFDLTFPLAGSDEWVTTFTAALVEISPAHWREEPKAVDGQMYVEESVRVYAQGSVQVRFKPGDTMSNISIVVQGDLSRKVIAGTIQTEDGGTSSSLSVYVSANGFNFPGEVSDDGTYRVQGVPSGSVLLVCDTGSRIEKTERFGFRSVKDYCNEYVTVNVPDKEETVSVNIVLHKAGHLAGVVLDKNGSPADGLAAKTETAKGVPIEDMTDLNGLFWLGPLQENQTYTVEVTGRRDSKPLARFEGLKPTIENIIIGMKGEN